MKHRVLGILTAALILWFGLSGCQSCSCEKPETDGRDQATRQPQPGPGDLRVVVESPGGPAEAGAGGQPRQRDNRAVDLSGAPLVEPAMPDQNTKAPPATMRITGVMKRMQEERAQVKGEEPKEPVPPPNLADDHLPRQGKRGKGKLVRGRPRGAKNARPEKKPARGRKAGTPH
jgi:hypothetical protein